MKKTITICISALLKSSNALDCVDERVRAAYKAQQQIKKQIIAAADLQVKAMTEAHNIPSKQLLDYEKIRNTLKVALVAAKSYQQTAEQTTDIQARANAESAVTAAMTSMTYEEGKPGSGQIKKAIEDMNNALIAVKLAEDRKTKNEKELVDASAACVPGQAATGWTNNNSNDNSENESPSESIPAQINLKQVIKNEVCPEQCKKEQKSYTGFNSQSEKEQWLENCIGLCNIQDNPIDKDYENFQNNRAKYSINAAQMITPTNTNNLNSSAIKKTDYTNNQDFVKLIFACRKDSKIGTACFDEFGNQIQISVLQGDKNKYSAAVTTNTDSNKQQSSCSLWERFFNTCDSIRAQSVPYIALVSSIALISLEQY